MSLDLVLETAVLAVEVEMQDGGTCQQVHALKFAARHLSLWIRDE